MKPQVESRLRKPALELLKFDGNPLTYLKFISASESTIEAVEHDDKVKLLYLIQYCSGKAKSIIEYCLLLEPHQGFVKAKQILYETYGKRNVIARSYIANLLEGPSVKKNDSQALIELARKVEECYTTLAHLNCFENISKIVRRLPFDLQSRWLRISAGVEKSFYANSLNCKSKPGSVFGVNRGHRDIQGLSLSFRQSDDVIASRPSLRRFACNGQVVRTINFVNFIFRCQIDRKTLSHWRL